MTNQEAIDTIKTAIAEVEWDYPMDYAAAFDMAVEALAKNNNVPGNGWISADNRPPERETIFAKSKRTAQWNPAKFSSQSEDVRLTLLDGYCDRCGREIQGSKYAWLQHKTRYAVQRLIPSFMRKDWKDTEKYICPDCEEQYIHWFMNPEPPKEG